MESQKSLLICVIPVLLLFSLSSFISGDEISLNDIINRNIASVNGKIKLESVRNISFQHIRALPTADAFIMVYATTDGKVKISHGNPPLVETTILFRNGKVTKNSFASTAEMTDIQKAAFIFTARLYSGVFTLKNFSAQLSFDGLKKYGPEEFYLLSTALDNINATFYVDKQSYQLRRLVIDNNKAADEKYQISFDFEPAVENAGLKIPNGWYRSDLGLGASAGGDTYEIKNFTVNRDLEDSFFDNADLNYGNVTFRDGALTGDATSSYYDKDNGGFVVLNTNFQEMDIKKLGLNPKNSIQLKINEMEMNGVFLSSTADITEDFFSSGKMVLLKYGRLDYYWIFLFGEKYKPLNDNFKPLTGISLKIISK